MKKARIAFLLGQPTQFDAPFFRHANAAGKASVTVLYATSAPSSSVDDPELGRKVDWGFDLFSGYEHAFLPASGRLRWLWRELRPERHDWLISNGYTTLFYAVALLIARLRGIRTALRIDSVLFNAVGSRRWLLKRGVLMVLSACIHRFFATGSLARAYLTHFGIPRDRISLFPYCVDVDGFRAAAGRAESGRADLRRRLGVPADAKVALAVAKMTTRETPWDLIEAMAGLGRPDIWCVIAGDGDLLDALRERAAARGMVQVRFVGYVPYPKLASYYVMADVFVHAAADEPWGVSVQEAIACGLPVVASSRVGAAHDLVLPGRNGFAYACGDAAELRAKLLATIDDLDRESVSAANRELLGRWNYARIWDDMIEACA